MPNLRQLLQGAMADNHEDNHILHVGTVNLTLNQMNNLQFQQRPQQRRRLIQPLENLDTVNAVTFTMEETEALVPTIAYQGFIFADNQFLWSVNFKKYLKLIAHYRRLNPNTYEFPELTFNTVFRAARTAMTATPTLANDDTLSWVNLQNEDIALIHAELLNQQLPVNSTYILIFFFLLHPILIHPWFASSADRQTASASQRNFYCPCPFCHTQSPLRLALAAPLRQRFYPPRENNVSRLLYDTQIRIHCQSPSSNAYHNAEIHPNFLLLHKFFRKFVEELQANDLPASVQADHNVVLPDDQEFHRGDNALPPPANVERIENAAANDAAPQAHHAAQEAPAPAHEGPADNDAAADEAAQALGNMDVDHHQNDNHD